MNHNNIIAVDFDGTITTQSPYPYTGQVRPEAIRVLKRLKTELDYKLLLWTCRENHELEEALMLLSEHGLKFDYVNNIPTQMSRKPHVKYVIDDKNLLSRVNWKEIEDFFFGG